MSAAELKPGAIAAIEPALAGAGKTAAGDIYNHHGESEPAPDRHSGEVVSEETVKAYWGENVRLLLTLVVVWFAVSFGAGILLVDQLNQFSLGGYPLGFWFAQQGSIYVFVALIFFYGWRMKKIERRYGVDDDA